MGPIFKSLLFLTKFVLSRILFLPQKVCYHCWPIPISSCFSRLPSIFYQPMQAKIGKWGITKPRYDSSVILLLHTFFTFPDVYWTFRMIWLVPEFSFSYKWCFKRCCELFYCLSCPWFRLRILENKGIGPNPICDRIKNILYYRLVKVTVWH